MRSVKLSQRSFLSVALLVVGCSASSPPEAPGDAAADEREAGKATGGDASAKDAGASRDTGASKDAGAGGDARTAADSSTTDAPSADTGPTDAGVHHDADGAAPSVPPGPMRAAPSLAPGERIRPTSWPIASSRVGSLLACSMPLSPR